MQTVDDQAQPAWRRAQHLLKNGDCFARKGAFSLWLQWLFTSIKNFKERHKHTFLHTNRMLNGGGP